MKSLLPETTNFAAPLPTNPLSYIYLRLGFVTVTLQVAKSPDLPLIELHISIFIYN